MTTQQLVFSLDQGWGNGVVASQDLDGVRRFAETLKTLPPRYQGCAGVTPSFAFSNPIPTETVLHALADQGVPFYLDCPSSDVLAMGLRPTLGCPYDLAHGVAIPSSQVKRWAAVFGSSFAGMRGHEQITTSRTVACGRNGTLPWWEGFADNAPTDSFYRLKLTEPFVGLCHALGKPFLWSEPMWSRSEHLWPGTPNKDDGWGDTYSALKFEQHIIWLANAYPGTVIPVFANNYPASASRQNDYWNDLNQAVFSRTNNAAGWGLGDQSWAWSADGQGSPAIDAAVDSWAAQALRYAAKVVWFEPPWLMFNFPPYSFGPTNVAPAPDSGSPTTAFTQLVASLP